MVAVAHQMSIFDSITIPEIQRLANRGTDVWATMVSVGTDALNDIERAKWLIGDLALCAIATYANSSRARMDLLDTYARAINVDPKHVRNYLKVSKFWKPNDRYEMSARRLTYDHMKDAMRLGNVERAKKFLCTVADNQWTVDQARLKLSQIAEKPRARKKALEAEATLIEATGTLYLFQIHPDPDADSAPVQLSIGDVYKIAIFTEE